MVTVVGTARREYLSPLEPRWYLPTAAAAEHVAHLLTQEPAAGLHAVLEAVCGERRRSWTRPDPTTPAEVQFCRRCLGRVRRSAPPRRGAAAAAVPARYAADHAGYVMALSTAPLSDSTRRNYASRVAAVLRWSAEQNLRSSRWTEPGLLGRYREHLVDLARPRETVNAHLAAFEDFLRRTGRTVDAPAGRLATDGAGQYLRPAEEADLLRAAAGLSRRDQAVVELLRLGLKVGELLRLTAADLEVDDPDGPALMAGGSGAASRQLRLSDDLLDLVVPGTVGAAGGCRPLLSDRDAGPLTSRRVHGIVAQAGRAAGIAVLNPQVLRTTWAAHAWLAGDGRLAGLLGVSPSHAGRIAAAIAQHTQAQHQAALDATPTDHSVAPEQATLLANAAGAVLRAVAGRPYAAHTEPQQWLGAALLGQLVGDGVTADRLHRQLGDFARRHRLKLSAIYRRFANEAPSALIHQPEALLLWRAVQRGGSLPDWLPAADRADMAALWTEPAGPRRPPTPEIDDW